MHGRVSLGTSSSTRVRRPARVPPTARRSRRCRAGRSNRASPPSTTARPTSSRSQTGAPRRPDQFSSPADPAGRSRPPRRRSTSAWRPGRSRDRRRDAAELLGPGHRAGDDAGPGHAGRPHRDHEPVAALDDVRGAGGEERGRQGAQREGAGQALKGVVEITRSDGGVAKFFDGILSGRTRSSCASARATRREAGARRGPRRRPAGRARRR
jgi:hypothetical protein